MEVDAAPSDTSNGNAAGQGFRSEAFRQAYLLALKHALRTPDFKTFSEAFPNFPAALLDALYDVYQQALLLVRANSEVEFEHILAEQSLVDKLDALDQLCVGQGLLPGQSTQPQDAGALAQLFPAAHIQAQVNRSKEAEVERLKRMLEDLEATKASIQAEHAAKQAAVRQAVESFKPVGCTLSQLQQHTPS